MYLHEKDESKKFYIIIAICFHIALFLGIFMFKSSSDELDATQQENPPESSTQDNAIVSDENLKSEDDIAKEKEIEALNSQSMKANAVPAEQVEKAIKDHNNKIAEDKAEAERERQEKIREIAAEKKRVADAIEKKRQDEIALNKKIEDEKQAKIKEQEDLKAQKKLEKQKELLEAKKKEQEALDKKREIQEAKEKAELLEKAKAAEELRKQKSAEAIKKSEAERQSLLKKKAAEATKKANQNRGYDSDKDSISNDQKLAYLRAYRDDVYNKVYSNWLRPSYSKRGWECKVHVTQSSTGQVRDVKIISCQGDADFQNSVKKAIFKSSPLPLPKHDSLFNNTIEIKFKVT